MSSICFKTKYLLYEINENGQNLQFTSALSGQNRIANSPCAVITNNDHTVVNASGVSLCGDVLEIRFSDCTTAEVLVTCCEEYLTFTLKSVSRENFLSISFVNILLDDNSEDYHGCLVGMTLNTHMQEHPGNNKLLRASSYPHIGLFSTIRSAYPSKAAIIGTPKELLRDIERCVIKEIPKGELPLSYKGGPYADLAAKEAQGTYSILFETVTKDNVEDVIDSMRRFCITQITLHHYGHYVQGDFHFDKNKYPNGMSDFKHIIDLFHEAGFLVGLQTYSFFLVPESSYVTPIPHRDLDTLREFTLKDDISVSDTTINVCESTEGMTPEEGYTFVNSPYLWIDDELICFTKVKDRVFSSCKRGAYGTTPSAHKKGALVRQLKQYFFLPVARAGSELFYEIARNTARFYNECGADFFYLDALDGAFILDGEDYVWYHAADFMREMFQYLERDPIFDCCYNPQYTSSWFARSRYGAVDVSLCAHRQYIDAHVKYNLETASRMNVTPELGWIDLYPKFSPKEDLWQNEPLFAEDLEYICAKAYATGASLAFLEGFHQLKNLLCSAVYCNILQKYDSFRKTSVPSAVTQNYLKEPENAAILDGNTLYKAKYAIGTIEQNGYSFSVSNPFQEQVPSFRIEALCAAESYNDPAAVTLCELNENQPIKNQCFRFEKPIDSKGNRGLGVWCCGDNSGAIVCIALRNFTAGSQRCGEHFIHINFSGWRYFAFYENQNGTLPANDWPRKELKYTTYTELQKFYHYYRPNLDYSAIDGVDIRVKGSGNILLKSIRLVPHRKTVWHNPKIKCASSEIQFYTDLHAEQILCFDGESCKVTDSLGNILNTPNYKGNLFLKPGENTISLSHENAEKYVRAKMTLTVKGDKLQ